MKLDTVFAPTSLDDVPALACWDDVAAKVQARYEGILVGVAFCLPFQPGADTERWRQLVRAFA